MSGKALRGPTRGRTYEEGAWFECDDCQETGDPDRGLFRRNELLETIEGGFVCAGCLNQRRAVEGCLSAGAWPKASLVKADIAQLWRVREAARKEGALPMLHAVGDELLRRGVRLKDARNTPASAPCKEPT